MCWQFDDWSIGLEDHVVIFNTQLKTENLNSIAYLLTTVEIFVNSGPFSYTIPMRILDYIRYKNLRDPKQY